MRFLEARFGRIDDTLAAMETRMKHLERTVTSVLALRTDEAGGR